MKFNWGFGILVGMLCFIGFILFLVIKLSTNSAYNHSLVTDNYYAEELVFQQEIQQEDNLKKLSKAILGKKTKLGWQITFPEEVYQAKVKGKVFLYRPSNQNLDFDLPFITSESNLLIPDKHLVDGRWNIRIEWEMQGEKYLYKSQFFY